MPTLKHCIDTVFGATLSKAEAGILKGLVKDYRDEGYSAREANVGAIQDFIKNLQDHRAEVIADINKQTGRSSEAVEGKKNGQPDAAASTTEKSEPSRKSLSASPDLVSQRRLDASAEDSSDSGINPLDETPTKIRSRTDENGKLKDFGEEKIVHFGIRDALQKGVLSPDESAVIDGILESFPDAWREHFEPRFSEQSFAPVEEQAKKAGYTKAELSKNRLQVKSVLIAEKIGPLKEDAKHLAVMFRGSDVVDFIHEFGEFVHTRLLSATDIKDTVNPLYEKYLDQAKQNKQKKKERNEWFADSFEQWWVDRKPMPEGLARIFRKVLRAIKSIVDRFTKASKIPRQLDILFSDIITNGRDIKEKYYYSDAEILAKYVVGSDPTQELMDAQGFSGNSKTYLSWDPSSLCPKQDNFIQYMLEKMDEAGLSQESLLDLDVLGRLYDEAIQDGIDVPCSYCYVEQARRKAIAYYLQGKSITGVNFAMAKQIYRTVPYRDRILKMSGKEIDALNKRGGLRLFSFSDYIRAAHRAEVDTLLTHAKERGLSVKAITKNPDFVEDFGDRGITINMSIDMAGEGMDWGKAAEFKKQYPNVKVRSVALNLDEVVQLAELSHKGVDQFVDVITPYHHDDKTTRIPEGYVDMGHGTTGGNQLTALVNARADLNLAERLCCQVGGKCYSEAHKKQCAANCGNIAGNLSVPLQPVESLTGSPSLSLAKEPASEGPPAKPKVISPQDQIHAQVKQRMDEISFSWKGIEIQTIRSFTDLPPDTASSVMDSLIPDGATDEEFDQRFNRILTRTEGFYHPKNRKIYIISSNCKTTYRAEEVLLHEAVGHHGMRALLGDRYDAFLNEVATLYGNTGLQNIARLYGFDLNTQAGRMRAADELIARLAEKDERPGFLKRLYAAVREALRKLGFQVQLSDDDIKAMLVASRKGLGNAQGNVGIHKEGSLLSKSELIGDKGFNLENFNGRVSQYTRSKEIAEAMAGALNRAYSDADTKIFEPYPGLYEVNWKNTARTAARIPHPPVAYPKGRMTDAQKRAQGIETWDMAAEWTGKSFDEGKPETFLSLSASEALDKLQTRLQGTPKAEIEILFGRNADLRELRDSFRIPAWLAKTNQTVKRFFDRQNERDKERSSLYHGFLETTQDAFNLDGKEQNEFGKLAFRLENKKVVEESTYIKAGERALVKGPENEVVMVPVYELNPEHYTALDTYLEGEKVNPNVRKAYVAVRKALDTTWVMALDRLMEIRNIDPVLIQKYRTDMGRIHNYFPHNRYGNHFIRAVDPKAKPGEDTRYRRHFNAVNGRHAQFWYTRNIDSILAELKNTRPETNWGELRWEVGKNQQLPEEVYDFPLPIDAMQQIIDAAVDSMPEEEGMKQALRKELSREISDTLKSRGFGSHMIERKDIPGHETLDPLRVVHDHLAGFAGWLTKMNAAHDFGNMLREIGARERPNEYKWATRFVNDMLQNSTELDRFVDGARTFFFLKYLGLSFKTAIVNLTQNFISGIPRLSMDIGGVKASRGFLAATNDIKLAVTKKGLAYAGKGRFTEEERQFLAEMFHEGWGQAQLVAELQGKVGGPFKRHLAKAARVMGLPMEMAERFNRMSLGLAAFRAAKVGMIENKKTLRELKLQAGEKASLEVAKQFAETVVNDSHFIYGKSNRPAFLRGTAAGKVLSTSYTFRSFSHNLLSMWRWMLTEGDREGKKAFAYSLLAMTAFGGIGSLPLYASLASLIRQIFGEDVLGLGIRKSLPKGMRDLVMYGVPSVIGVNIGGSIGMDLPVVDRMRVNQPLAGQLGTAIGELVGIPFAVLEEFTDAVDALRSGRVERALESASPTFLRNVLSGVRLATEGQTTITGRPVNVPGETGPRKITTAEAFGKGLGFQPLSSSKAFEMHRSLEEVKSYRDQQQEEFANRYLEAERARNNREMTRIREETRLWNRRAVLEKKPELKIDLDRAVKARMKARQLMKQMRGLARDFRESFEM